MIYDAWHDVLYDVWCIINSYLLLFRELLTMTYPDINISIEIAGKLTF